MDRQKFAVLCRLAFDGRKELVDVLAAGEEGEFTEHFDACFGPDFVTASNDDAGVEFFDNSLLEYVSLDAGTPTGGNA